MWWHFGELVGEWAAVPVTGCAFFAARPGSVQIYDVDSEGVEAGDFRRSGDHQIFYLEI